VLTTHVFPFAGLEEAFELMRTKRDGVIKPLIQFAEMALPAAADAAPAGARCGVPELPRS
jgi:hypothetical protein